MQNKICLLILLLTVAAPQWLVADTARLITAVKEDDVFQALLELRAGTNPNATEPGGRSALEIAARAGNFEMCKFLLWHGANPFDRNGRRIADALPDQIQASPPENNDNATLLNELLLTGSEEQQTKATPNTLKQLLRAYAFLKKTARPPATVRTPELAVMYEPMVDYEHPKLRAAYHVNLAEKNGRTGVDDDNNGFVDDVYGWSSRVDGPFEINELQRKTFRDNSRLLDRWVKLYNSEQMREQDEEMSPDWLALRNSFKNPLSKIFGPSPGNSDFDFLIKVVELSHGTHVAGIIAKNSRGKARLHTVSWGTYDRDMAFQARFTISSNVTLKTLTTHIEDQIRPILTRNGKRGSDYLRNLGPGVVNASMGQDYDMFWLHASETLHNFIELHDLTVENDEMSALVSSLANEFYLYDSIPFAIAGAENPNTLFVIAAGNDNKNNDDTLQTPAYLSRYFPNTITIAAADKPDGEITHFSNFGSKSVNLGAPGRRILSQGFSGIPDLYMDGTSMAAPAVAGCAALIRSQHPEITAAKLRRILENSGAGNEDWANYVSSGACLSPERAEKLANEDPQTLSDVAYELGLRHTKKSNPEALCDALDYSARAVVLCKTNADIHWTRAIVLENTGFLNDALSAIDAGIAVSDKWPGLWRTRGAILEELDRQADALKAYDRCVALLRNPTNPNGWTLIDGLPTRARLLKKMGRLADARKDVAEIVQKYGVDDLASDLQDLN